MGKIESTRRGRWKRRSRRSARSNFLLFATACLLGGAIVALLHPSSLSVPSLSGSEVGIYLASNPFEYLRVLETAPPTSAGLYSVIPGGIHSEEQLAEVLATDPVVARHYAGFDLLRFRFVHLRHGLKAYVSYRLGNQIFWTDKKIALFAGETLVTDGTNYVRARCGNRISEVPRQPTSPWQPPLTQLSLPILHPKPVLPALPPIMSVGVHDFPMDDPPGSSGDAPFFPVIYVPPSGGSGGTPGTHGCRQ